ncbi:MAG: serine O-acetyltransferase [Pseudomonadota bacterium]
MTHNSVQSETALKTVDPLWTKVYAEAELIIKAEPTLASFVYANILQHKSLEDALCHRVARRLENSDVDISILIGIFTEILDEFPKLSEIVRSDLAAVYDRDPACSRLVDPLLYFKGFHALQTYRFAHQLWSKKRKDFALYLQSQCSRIFAIDIHPAAEIGKGIMMDHATGIVIGETAKVGDNTSILHNVTLGGTGKETADRHPKIGSGVMLGAGAKILGNIHIGDCSRVAAGSVVVKDVPKCTTVAGVPARVIGPAGCPEPFRSMDQMVQSYAEDPEN